MAKINKFKVKDLKLAAQGRTKIEWAESRMPVLAALRAKYKITKPFKGFKIAGCLHVTKETAVLIRTFIDAGAELSWSGCNPLSTQDDVAAALAADGVSIYAWHGMNTKEFYWCIDRTLDFKPQLTLDDGADLIFTVHNKYQNLVPSIIGGTEETTTGVHRLRKMAEQGALKYPVYAVNDSVTKWDFDNVYGTGQSTIDGILRATSVLIAGKNFVVAGYGHCGSGVANRAKGLGASTITTEIKPTAALKATLEGHRVLKMDEAAKVGDIFVTATGVKDVIVGRHFASMKDGAIVCNTGHYDCEINLTDLEKMKKSKRTIRPNCEEYLMKDGRKIYILAKGRLVNLSAAEGHPSEVMDMSFANQFNAQLALVSSYKAGKKLTLGVHVLPREMDEQIAGVKLSTMNIKIDKLTKDQIKYNEDFSEGT
ncbi:MAG: adenosylhomocysteinase [Ignavibacteria bacterium]